RADELVVLVPGITHRQDVWISVVGGDECERSFGVLDNGGALDLRYRSPARWWSEGKDRHCQIRNDGSGAGGITVIVGGDRRADEGRIFPSRTVESVSGGGRVLAGKLRPIHSVGAVVKREDGVGAREPHPLTRVGW